MKEFFKLAAVWLDIRQHQINKLSEPLFLQIAELDYQSEMYLLLSEIRKERR